MGQRNSSARLEVTTPQSVLPVRREIVEIVYDDVADSEGFRVNATSGSCDVQTYANVSNNNLHYPLNRLIETDKWNLGQTSNSEIHLHSSNGCSVKPLEEASQPTPYDVPYKTDIKKASAEISHKAEVDRVIKELQNTHLENEPSKPEIYEKCVPGNTYNHFTRVDSESSLLSQDSGKPFSKDEVPPNTGRHKSIWRRLKFHSKYSSTDSMCSQFNNTFSQNMSAIKSIPNKINSNPPMDFHPNPPPPPDECSLEKANSPRLVADFTHDLKPTLNAGDMGQFETGSMNLHFKRQTEAFTSGLLGRNRSMDFATSHLFSQRTIGSHRLLHRDWRNDSRFNHGFEPEWHVNRNNHKCSLSIRSSTPSIGPPTPSGLTVITLDRSFKQKDTSNPLIDTLQWSERMSTFPPATEAIPDCLQLMNYQDYIKVKRRSSTRRKADIFIGGNVTNPRKTTKRLTHTSNFSRSLSSKTINSLPNATQLQIYSYQFWVRSGPSVERVFHNPRDRRIESIGRLSDCRIRLTTQIRRSPKGFAQRLVSVIAPNADALRKCCKMFDDKFPQFFATSGGLFFDQNSMVQHVSCPGLQQQICTLPESQVGEGTVNGQFGLNIHEMRNSVDRININKPDYCIVPRNICQRFPGFR
ncbi:hypothetical protein T265_06758 [Opisthorchis viverrini]|uniref:Uncharacterized protein n=1 Tax=Opisthorchis viverrini TaxID=6198 RepID=A0A074ZRD1_OPIVI|nr:hypothetical protein T265_06758 [Opisthorchis viverrini]KER25905.1 hypothetical protein T265_06758 [Opisthorchis viverrini]